MIREISIITAGGAKTYRMGNDVHGKVIDKIQVAQMHFQGDPFDHYIGYTSQGEMIFTVNCLCPCNVEYL